MCINIDRMIRVVCELIKREYGIDILRASEITDAEIQDEILARCSEGERFNDVVKDVKAKYCRDILPFENERK